MNKWKERKRDIEKGMVVPQADPGLPNRGWLVAPSTPTVGVGRICPSPRLFITIVFNGILFTSMSDAKRFVMTWQGSADCRLPSN